MGVYLNPGNQGFQSALRSQIYVDKTELLAYTNKVMDSEQRYLCVSRPRRFGKSMAAEMLVAYYDKSCDSRELFQTLSIAKSKDFEKHLNQYSVIHIDVTSFLHRQKVPKKAMEMFPLSVIEELKESFPKCVKEEDSSLPYVLEKINNMTGEQFIIVIDEWDAIFREDKLDAEAQEVYIDLLRGLFKDASSKRFLKLAYMTGILPVKKYGTQSALNNFDEFTMINPSALSKYVGFTEEEVKALCSTYEMDFSEVKRWYDGYCFRREKHVYNPNSVVKAMLREEYDSYWSQTETYEVLKEYICMNFAGLKDDIIFMLGGGRCKVNFQTFQNDMASFHGKEDILTLLIHLGYLAYDADTQEVFIPNEEIKMEFKNAVKAADWNQVVQAIMASDALLKATWQKEEETVAAGIAAVHEANTSILSYHDENSLSCVISLAYYNAVNEYIVVREMPTGKGYADIVFLPRRYSDKPAMIIELKWNQSAKGAIAQIKDRHYVQALEEYKGKLLLVVINYKKETKKYQCCIEEMTVTG